MASRPSQPCATEFFIPPSYAQIRAKTHRNASGGSPSPGGLRADLSSPRLTPDSPRQSPIRRGEGHSTVHGRPTGISSMQRFVDAAADAIQSSGISLSRAQSEQPPRPGSLVFPASDALRQIPNGTRAVHVRHEEGHVIVELEPAPGENIAENGEGQGEDGVPKKKRRRRFRRPRRNSTLDKVIRLLEDKRVKDSSQLYQLQDMQLPQLRRVLNIIFVTLGVTFLLAVVVVIIYTTVGDV